MRVQANPAPALRAWLGPKFPGVTLADVVPDKWTPDTGPVIVLSDDGGPVVVSWGGQIVRSYHVIRVTVRGKVRTAVNELACTAAGHLSTARVPGFKVSGVGVVLESRDPKTGAALASVLVNVHARSREI
ncbi:hypothetical protein [Mycobacteroides abscessus]|uniref:hypothetical protein n=1 Tax=Mycobacteroides abscessus TaxID=36809 RepID=UPI0009A5D848|nr:hypothetical protein [Mycobacteroides abscessus]SLF39487.1 Uncharacterised protein [Mycobacteroides abscessus subsp. bolletii]